MEENGRRQRGKANESKVSRRRVPLADALTATSKHTVPVLPAFHPGDREPLGAPENGTQVMAADPEMTRLLAKAQLVMPDVVADSISPGATTEVVPLPTAKQMQAVTPPERALEAVPSLKVEESPTIFIRGARKPPRYNYARVVPRRQGSRSIVLQFTLALMTVMVLFSIFTAASPLGKSVTSLSFVQAYANSIPWVPTATPKPKPKPPVYSPPLPANPGTQAITNEIISVFGAYSQGALNVARCESGYDPGARNPYAVGNSHAEGVFQILYPSTWDTTSYASDSPYDANDNIHAAHQIFARDGDSWREWACQP
jgi:hypothetical protein